MDAPRGGRHLGQAVEALRGVESGASAQDSTRLGQVHGGHVGREDLDDDRVGSGAVDRGRLDRLHPWRRSVARRAGTGLHRDDDRVGHQVLGQHRPSDARGGDHVVVHRHRPGQHRAVELERHPGGEVTSIGRRREHHDPLGGEHRGQGRGPGRRSEAGGVPGPYLGGHAGQAGGCGCGTVADDDHVTGRGAGGVEGPRGKGAGPDRDDRDPTTRFGGRGRGHGPGR
jgi:hypothetical protein